MPGRRPAAAEEQGEPLLVGDERCPHFGKIRGTVIHSCNRSHASARVIEQALDNMRLRELPVGNLRRERAAQIVDHPIGDTAQSVKVSLRDAPGAEGSSFMGREEVLGVTWDELQEVIDEVRQNML